MVAVIEETRAVEVETPADEKQLAQFANDWPTKAESIVINSPETFNVAKDALTAIVVLRKQVTDHHAPMKDAAHKAHKVICDAEKEMLAPLTKAEALLKGKTGAFLVAQERIRKERERAAAEEARRLAEEEKLQEAIAAKADGASEAEVDAILESEVIATLPKIAPTIDKGNLSTSKRYSAKIVNIREFCRAIADGTIPESFALPNMASVNGRARTDKEAFKVPGCELVVETSVAVRS